MLQLRLHSEDRKSTRDKANINIPKLNRGYPPFTANRTSADWVQISLGPSIQYILLGVYWGIQCYVILNMYQQLFTSRDITDRPSYVLLLNLSAIVTTAAIG